MSVNIAISSEGLGLENTSNGSYTVLLAQYGELLFTYLE